VLQDRFAEFAAQPGRPAAWAQEIEARLTVAAVLEPEADSESPAPEHLDWVDLGWALAERVRERQSRTQQALQ
jgi:hypothetical protein